jgi:hypothetical protein
MVELPMRCAIWVALTVWSQSISASCGKSNWDFVWNSTGPCFCLLLLLPMIMSITGMMRAVMMMIVCVVVLPIIACCAPAALLSTLQGLHAVQRRQAGQGAAKTGGDRVACNPHTPQLLLLLPPPSPVLPRMIILLNVAAGRATATVIRQLYPPSHAVAVLVQRHPLVWRWTLVRAPPSSFDCDSGCLICDVLLFKPK